MARIFDRVKFNVSGTPNQGTCTVGTRSTASFYLPAEVNAGSSEVFYLLVNGSGDEEHGIGTVASDGSTVSRDTVLASIISGTAGTTKINVSTSSTMGFTNPAETFKSLRGSRIITGTTDTIVDLDGGAIVRYNNGTGVAVALAQAGTSSQFRKGWFVWLKNYGVGDVTITAATSLIVDATTSGATSVLVLKQGDSAFLSTDGTDYFVCKAHRALWSPKTVLSQTEQGVALKNIGAAQLTLVNGKIVALTPVSSTITFAMKTLSGNDPSATDPVCVIFPDGSQVVQTAALSVTIPATGTLQTVSAIPFHLWFAIINDSGTLRLGVRNCSNAAGCYPFPSIGKLSSTIITSPNAVGTTYTDVAVANKPFVVVAYTSFESGMATAGTWNASPDFVTMFAPGMPLPGQPTGISAQISSNTTLSNNTITYMDSALALSITLSSKANLVDTYWDGVTQIDTAGKLVYVALRRGGSIIGVQKRMGYAAANMITPISGSWMDLPGALSPSYVVSLAIDATAATGYFLGPTGGGVLKLAEVMG